MEPRSAERGNHTYDLYAGHRQYSFNGATLSRTWKLPARSITTVIFNELQWSHAQPNVETYLDNTLLAERETASMEPRSAERGNAVLRIGEGAEKSASMEPRSAERGNFKSGANACASSRRFNGATLSRTWKRSCSAISGGILASLQWSHAQPNVETGAGRQGARVCNSRASMEPRSAERGNKATRVSVVCARPCFNGATLSRTWKPTVTG